MVGQAAHRQENRGRALKDPLDRSRRIRSGSWRRSATSGSETIKRHEHRWGRDFILWCPSEPLEPGHELLIVDGYLGQGCAFASLMAATSSGKRLVKSLPCRLMSLTASPSF